MKTTLSTRDILIKSGGNQSLRKVQLENKKAVEL